MRILLIITVITLSSSGLFARSGDTVRPYELLQQEDILKEHDRVPTNTIENEQGSNKEIKEEVGPIRDL